jgi:hypothetical protein
LFLSLLSKASDQCCDTDDEEGPCDNPCKINQKKPIVIKKKAAAPAHVYKPKHVAVKVSHAKPNVRRVVVDKHVTVEASAEEALRKIREAAHKAQDAIADETVVGVKTEKVVAAKAIQKELKVAGSGIVHEKNVAATGVSQEKKVAVEGVKAIKAASKGAAVKAAQGAADLVRQWDEFAEDNVEDWKEDLKIAAKSGVKQEQVAASVGVAAVQQAASHAIQQLSKA